MKFLYISFYIGLVSLLCLTCFSIIPFKEMSVVFAGMGLILLGVPAILWWIYYDKRYGEIEREKNNKEVL